jgi:hypothetical protein
MLSCSRSRWPLGLGLGLSLLLLSPADAAQPVGPKPVTFETVDGVKLSGTYFASGKGRDAPVVLLLHDFEYKKGGDSHQNGLDDFAKALQKQGYAVLSFDFRGHGQSKEVNREVFWSRPYPYNANLVRGYNAAVPAKSAESINAAEFSPRYFPYLVNDIAAAKAFLDRKNDNGELNSSNLIVIGCGEGATLGVLWMSAEWKRHRAMFGAPPDEPEGRDQIGAIWLSLKGSLAGQNVAVQNWVSEVGGKYRVPMVFLYGKEDKVGSAEALRYIQAIIPKYVRGKPRSELMIDPVFAFTGEQEIDDGGMLKGSALLPAPLSTEKYILKELLPDLVEKRGKNEWRLREFEKNNYIWQFPSGALPARDPNGKAPRPIPLSQWRFPGPP